MELSHPWGVYLLLTCYLLSSQLRSEALSADISPDLVQPDLEHINRWSVDNLLRKPIPFSNRSLTEEVFPTVQSASNDMQLQTVSS